MARKMGRSSTVADPSTPPLPPMATNSSTSVSKWRNIFATFLSDASAALAPEVPSTNGKNKFRFASKIVLSMKNSDSYSQVFGLADVACRKDNGDILNNTCMPALMEGINTIEASTVVFSKCTDNDKGLEDSKFILNLTATNDLSSRNAADPSFNIKPTSFLAGDLAYLAVIMGKENFSSKWCNWCNQSQAEWQSCSDIVGDNLWDIDKINQQVKENETKNLTGVNMKGVRSSPLSIIPFSRCIFSGLHAGIGIGNRIIQYLEVFIDIDVEEISHEEFQLRETRNTTEHELHCLRKEKDIWNESPDGGKLLQKKRSRSKRIEIELKRNSDDALKLAEKDLLTSEMATLTNVRDEYTTQIKHLEKRLKGAKAALDEYTKSRCGGEDSIYTSVDRIFQKIGANRAHYFGRAFEGVDIRKIMASSDNLFGVGGSIRTKLLEVASSAAAREKIHQTCHNVGLALKLWDSAFSAIHASEITPDHCKKTQETIDSAMLQMRRMGISVTPKMHGMEKHIVMQMQTIPGGIGRLMEHWIEQYHQIGYRFDLAYCRVGTLEGQAAIRSRMEKRGMHPRVQMNIKALEKRFVGIKKKRSDAKARDEKKLIIKEEKRELAIAEMRALEPIGELEAICQKLDCDDEIDEIDDLAQLETEIFGLIVA